jgi:Uma2 family endonuclease
MITFVHDIGQVDIPPWVVDLASFRRWAEQDDFPEQGRICYLQGNVWVDVSREQVFTHVAVKTEFAVTVGGLVKVEGKGRYFADGLSLANILTDILVRPDGTFISHEALESEKIRLVKGAEEGFVEMEGTPDMVLEVVSTSSVHKDTVVLRQAYWEAGIEEYWLVDARKDPIRFDILRAGPKGYVAVRKQGGWLKSIVFGKSFRLTKNYDVQGHPQFTLAVR